MIPPIHPDPYILVLTGAGFLIALVAWLPLALKRLPLSLPIVCIAAGAVLSAVLMLPVLRLRGRAPAGGDVLIRLRVDAAGPSRRAAGDLLRRFTQAWAA